MPANEFGVLDHVVKLADGQLIQNSIRVVSNGDGSEVMFTLLQLPKMTEEQFEKDAAMFEAERRAGRHGICRLNSSEDIRSGVTTNPALRSRSFAYGQYDWLAELFASPLALYINFRPFFQRQRDAVFVLLLPKSINLNCLVD